MITMTLGPSPGTTSIRPGTPWKESSAAAASCSRCPANTSITSAARAFATLNIPGARTRTGTAVWPFTASKVEPDASATTPRTVQSAGPETA